MSGHEPQLDDHSIPARPRKTAGKQASALPVAKRGGGMMHWITLWVRRGRKAPQWLRAVLSRCLAGTASQPTALCTSLDLAEDRVLATLIGKRPGFHSRLQRPRAREFIGWGRKWSGQRAVDLGHRTSGRFLLLEDGFLRSVARFDPPLSMVFDRVGIYYDASQASELERSIPTPLSARQQDRARHIANLWRRERVSKYNNGSEFSGDLPGKYILVVDQTGGDASIRHGMADAGSFARMLQTAIAENPGTAIVVKVHPDSAMRAHAGHFDIAALRMDPRILVISDPCHPVRLIENANAVYTVTSQVGFEALLWGKPVRVFGMPFYAGWGLTQDELPAPDRRQPAGIEQLIHAALVRYPRYIDPVTMRRCEVERSIEHVGLQRRLRMQTPQTVHAVGFSRWKRPFIRRFLSGSHVTFANRNWLAGQSALGRTIAVWGNADAGRPAAGKGVLRIEDGFLRSSGLGADLVRPLSLVVDDVGIYYDSTRPSGLENILSNLSIDDVDRDRARRLRDRIVELDVTKYNLGSAPWMRPDTTAPVVLVVGQVETDASIRSGSPVVSTNLELVRRVRKERPSAFLVYKPHPDVVNGLRKPGADEDIARQLADQILTEPVSTGQLLSQVDELHTMTSLMGFEALLRGSRVVCHGLPFYAGWGLTEDRLPCPRRQRRLTIDELVHGALIAYPRYFDFQANCFIEPEQAVDALAALSREGRSTPHWRRKVLRSGLLFWLKLKGSTR